MIPFFEYQFMQNAFLAAILVGIACGIMGTYVVVKRLVFISGGIAHAAFGGVGLGLLLKVNPLLLAMPFSILSALGIGSIERKIKITQDSAIGILWSLGMALGILFIGLAPGYTPDLFSYLFGSILTVPFSDIVLMIIIDSIILLVVFLFYKEFQAISFDEEFSEVSGVPTRILYLLLLCLVASSIIMMIRVVGIILVIALLTMPAVIAKLFCSRLKSMMIFSSIIAVFFTLLGLVFSYIFDLPSGAVIVLTLAAAFGVASMVKYFFRNF
ncbi:MAG: metal ABC transporter permease [Nanobdellota archaeon]